MFLGYSFRSRMKLGLDLDETEMMVVLWVVPSNVGRLFLTEYRNAHLLSLRKREEKILVLDSMEERGGGERGEKGERKAYHRN